MLIRTCNFTVDYTVKNLRNKSYNKQALKLLIGRYFYALYGKTLYQELEAN